MRGAEADLRRITNHIRVDNPNAARAMVERILERCADLADFPEQGRTVGGRRRELVVAGTPYLAVYRLVGDEVQILRVLHGRQERR